MGEGYGPVVGRLLKLGRGGADRGATKYGKLGITREHVGELIRLATDERLNGEDAGKGEAWGPVHAWWALGELRAGEAVGALLGLLDGMAEREEDVGLEDVPAALGRIGEGVEAIGAYARDRGHREWARVAALNALTRIGEAHAEKRAACVAEAVAVLEGFADEQETVATMAMGVLVDLKAVETVGLIERAFAAGKIEERMYGSLADVKGELGLGPKRKVKKLLDDEQWGTLEDAVGDVVRKMLGGGKG